MYLLYLRAAKKSFVCPIDDTIHMVNLSHQSNLGLQNVTIVIAAACSPLSSPREEQAIMNSPSFFLFFFLYKIMNEVPHKPLYTYFRWISLIITITQDMRNRKSSTFFLKKKFV